jgi:hypothetical protein
MDEKSQEKKSQQKKSWMKSHREKSHKKKSHRKKSQIYNAIFQIIKVFCKNYFNALIFNLFILYINIFFLNRDPVVYLVHVFNS